MVKYMIKKQAYDDFMEEFGHIDFTHLSYLPVLVEEEEMKDFKQVRLEEEYRYVRTKSILGKEQ
jgi:hypothetical protein